MRVTVCRTPVTRAVLVVVVVSMIALTGGCGGGGPRPPKPPPIGRIAFVGDREGNAEIYVMNADGTGETRLTHHPLADWGPAWSPDETRIAFTGLAPWPGAPPFTPPPSGTGDIHVTSLNGGEPRRLTEDGHSERPQWSPDGARIAFSSRRDGNEEIYVMNADGTGQANLTNHPADDSYATWSPDGTRIAFMRHPKRRNADIYVMNADGTGQTNLTNHPADDSYAAWSPDGTMIAFMRRPEHGNADMYVMNADGGEQTNLTNYRAGETCDAAWSPDGSTIAFVMDMFSGGISVIGADGSGYRQLTVRGWWPAWSPDGRHIAFANFRPGGWGWDIRLVSADGGRVANLTRSPGDDYAPAWSPAHVGASGSAQARRPAAALAPFGRICSACPLFAPGRPMGRTLGP